MADRLPDDQRPRVFERLPDRSRRPGTSPTPVWPALSFRITMLRVKKGPCAPLRLSSMLSCPATGMTRIDVIARCAGDVSSVYQPRLYKMVDNVSILIRQQFPHRALGDLPRVRNELNAQRTPPRLKKGSRLPLVSRRPRHFKYCRDSCAGREVDCWTNGQEVASVSLPRDGKAAARAPRKDRPTFLPTTESMLKLHGLFCHEQLRRGVRFRPHGTRNRIVRRQGCMGKRPAFFLVSRVKWRTSFAGSIESGVTRCGRRVGRA